MWGRATRPSGVRDRAHHGLLARQPIEIRVDHHVDQLLEVDRRLPAEHAPAFDGSPMR